MLKKKKKSISTRWTHERDTVLSSMPKKKKNCEGEK